MGLFDTLPAYPATLNTAHTDATYLTHAWLFNAGSGTAVTDLKTAIDAVYNGGWNAGGGADFNGSSHYLAPTAAGLPSQTPPFLVVIGGYFHDIESAKYNHPVGKTNNLTSMWIRTQGVGGCNQGYNGGTTPVGTLSNNTEYVLGFSVINSGGWPGQWTMAEASYVCAQVDAGAYLDGRVAFVYIFAGAYTLGTLMSNLAASPYGMFAAVGSSSPSSSPSTSSSVSSSLSASSSESVSSSMSASASISPSISSSTSQSVSSSVSASRSESASSSLSASASESASSSLSPSRSESLSESTSESVSSSISTSLSQSFSSSLSGSQSASASSSLSASVSSSLSGSRSESVSSSLSQSTSASVSSSLSTSRSESVSSSVSRSRSQSTSDSLSQSRSQSLSESLSESLSQSVSSSLSASASSSLSESVSESVSSSLSTSSSGSLSASRSPSMSSSLSESVSSSRSESGSTSQSPSLSISASPSPAPPRAIRRMRQTPYLNDELAWLYFSELQIDLELGQGRATGRQQPHGEPGPEGVNVTVFLQWSDDGGHTWSEEHPVDIGGMGLHQHRAIWRRLGRARTRTWRVYMTDPVAWYIVDAYIKVAANTAKKGRA